jgi:hypothetical protein
MVVMAIQKGDTIVRVSCMFFGREFEVSEFEYTVTGITKQNYVLSSFTEKRKLIPKHCLNSVIDNSEDIGKMIFEMYITKEYAPQAEQKIKEIALQKAKEYFEYTKELYETVQQEVEQIKVKGEEPDYASMLDE